MVGSILGTAVVRKEDPALLRGARQFVEDLFDGEMLHAVFVRSEVPHGRIVDVHVDLAAGMPGVVGVHTAGTLGLGMAPSAYPLDSHFERPLLASDTVRHVGQSVAVVVADTHAQAVDAAAEVTIDYEALPSRADVDEAATGETVVCSGRESDLKMYRFGEVDDLHAEADHVVTARFVNNRIAVVPMETHGILARPAEDGRTEVFLSTQGVHNSRSMIAGALGLDETLLHVMAPAVGGGFGAKGGADPEHIVVVALARALGRPVGWKESRSENVLSMPARGQVQYVRMGLTENGTITSLEAQLIGDGGAYPAMGVLLPMAATRTLSQNVYEIPRMQIDGGGVATNTPTVRAFRGAGRPEASAMVERMLEMASHDLGLDPIDVRRRNFLRPDSFPYETRTGAVYDSGDYERTLDEALRVADVESWRAEQRRRRETDAVRQLGIGVGCYTEITAGAGTAEWGAVTVEADGSATVRVGTSSHGHGHDTTFSMVVSDRLGIPIDRIRFIDADTDEVPRGGGTAGSRSAQTGGVALHRSAEAVLERARPVAAALLEANPDDIVVHEGGGLGVVGVPDRTVSWAEVVASAGEPLREEVVFDQEAPTFPFGSHVSIVEVDLETGEVVPLLHVAVDDCGTVINPVVVAGQQHGGIASAIGQALFEDQVFDRDGTPRTTNLADYGMPSAAEMPPMVVSNTETPSPLNPLGVKGIGEAGTIGALPAVQNAVIDAVRHLGVRHIDLPLSAASVWHAVETARRVGRFPVDEVAWPALRE